MGLPRSGAKGAPHLPLHHVPPGRLPPAGSASVSSAQPGPGVVVQVKDHPRPALLGEPGPLRGAPRHPAPARRSASLPGAPRPGQASAAGSSSSHGQRRRQRQSSPSPSSSSSISTPAELLLQPPEGARRWLFLSSPPLPPPQHSPLDRGRGCVDRLHSQVALGRSKEWRARGGGTLLLRLVDSDPIEGPGAISSTVFCAFVTWMAWHYPAGPAGRPPLRFGPRAAPGSAGRDRFTPCAVTSTVTARAPST